MDTEERSVPADADENVELPAIVLPPMGGIPTQNMSMGAGTITGAPIIPEMVAPETATPDNLSNRVEEMLAEDGRFSTLLTNLTFSASSATGQVVITGPHLDPALLPALVNALLAVPGVVTVTDSTRPTA